MRWLASSPMILCWDCFLGKPREHGVDKALDFQKTLGGEFHSFWRLGGLQARHWLLTELSQHLGIHLFWVPCLSLSSPLPPRIILSACSFPSTYLA